MDIDSSRSIDTSVFNNTGWAEANGYRCSLPRNGEELVTSVKCFVEGDGEFYQIRETDVPSIVPTRETGPCKMYPHRPQSRPCPHAGPFSSDGIRIYR